MTGLVYSDLQHFVEEYRDGLPEHWISQDNNTPSHCAAVAQEFKENQGIQPLPWPANCLDLNPIEHAWDCLDRRVSTHPTEERETGREHCNRRNFGNAYPVPVHRTSI